MTTPLAYQTVTVAAAAIGLDLSGAAAPLASGVFIRCESADVRWRDDGTDPTAAVGTPLLAGETLTYEGNLSRIKFIRQGSVSATVHVSFYRP